MLSEAGAEFGSIEPTDAFYGVVVVSEAGWIMNKILVGFG